MHPDHYAIVIGLSSYPHLGDPPRHLKGPENDAKSVEAWLTDPQGGGLLKNHVKLICSALPVEGSVPPVEGPTRGELEEAFLWLDKLAEKAEQEGRGRTVGTRLYLYAAGHGFSPKVRQGCLLAGNAADRQFTANISPSGWVEWWQDAEYFREFVLWLDCCMDPKLLAQPTPPPLDPIGGDTAPGPTFIAFAAARPLKAVEKSIPEDRKAFHGVFTWNLLQGLRGAAANSFGIVTGASLANWLRQAQLGWLENVDRTNPDIAKEPAIYADDELVFARGLDPMEFKIRMVFPTEAVGKKVRLWSGTPPAPGPALSIIQPKLTVDLKPGLYLVEVPGTALRQGFVVTRNADVVVTETGSRPQQASGFFHLSVEPGDSTAEIRLFGDGFHTIDVGRGSLSARLPFGLYGMRIRIGRQVTEKLVLLDSDWPKSVDQLSSGFVSAQMLPVLPEITSAAPLPGTAATHEYQRDAAQRSVGRVDVQAGTGAELMVMTRMFSGNAAGVVDVKPWEGVAVLGKGGKIVADLTSVGEHRDGPDPVAVCTVALTPGTYVLRQSNTGGAPIEQSLVLPPGGWRLEVYLLHRPGFSLPATQARVALLMRRIGAPWGTANDLQIEKARVALADERPILNDELSDLLLRKFENPLAGIIGGHLLLIEREQSGRGRLELLNEVVTTLRKLVGQEHPDVEALSLACPDTKLQAKVPVRAAPLFERSWRMLIEASRKNRRLVPIALWHKVQMEWERPPFLCWLVDPLAQEALLKEFAKTIFEPRETMLERKTQSALAVPGPAEFASAAPHGSSGPSAPRQGARTRRLHGHDSAAAKKWAERFGLPLVALAALRKKYLSSDG